MGGLSRAKLVERTENSRDFSAACEARLPLRLTVRNERNGATDDVLLERPWALLGGDEHCDVRLLHPDVSQRHTYLQIVSSRLLCCDLGSRTGTHWSDEIRSRSWLKPQEPIFIGPYSVRVHDNDFVEGAQQVDGPRKLELPRVTLSFINARSRAGRSKKSRIRRPVTLIGWSHLCNIRLQHSSVGRVHASLIWTPSGLWVVDLLCRGGTSVNGQRVDAAPLREGDELTVGRFQLRITYTDPQESAVEPVSADSPTQSVSSLSNIAASGIAAIPPGHLPTLNGNGHTLEPALAPKLPVSVQLLQRPGEIPGLAAGVPLPPGNSTSETVAMALVQQFSVMQKELFDHTQQLLSMMAQTFNAAHSRQIDLIRSELMRVHEVNRELQELNLKLTLSQGAAPAAPSLADLAASARHATNADAASQPLNGPATKDTVPEQPTFSGESKPAEPQEPEEQTARRPERKPKRSKAERHPAEQGAAEGSERVGVDMHAWLSGRINELEQERTTRWQKILQLLAPTAGQS